MHILIAPNAFKHSLNAQDVASAIQKGLKLSRLNGITTCFPIADGGDGTAALLIEKLNGRRIEVMVHDALGRPLLSSFGLIDADTAVIEMAESSGLKHLDASELNPMKASSYGTGQVILAALSEGVKKIVIAMGGSATVDGGCGILSALGFVFLDEQGVELEAIPEKLIHLESIDAANVDPRILECEVVVLCDVSNKLLGTNGTAAIFGPQKGADELYINLLDGFLTKLSQVAKQQFNREMAEMECGGTAGGAAAGLAAFLNAKLVNGTDYFLNLTGFDEALKKADVLITGEGSLDLQTLQGKAPFGVAARAKASHIPVIGIAGKVPLIPKKEMLDYFNALIAIGNEPADLPEALHNAEENLIRTGINIGNLLSIPVGTFRNKLS